MSHQLNRNTAGRPGIEFAFKTLCSLPEGITPVPGLAVLHSFTADFTPHKHQLFHLFRLTLFKISELAWFWMVLVTLQI